jgi:hypothetical protein
MKILHELEAFKKILIYKVKHINIRSARFPCLVHQTMLLAMTINVNFGSHELPCILSKFGDIESVIEVGDFEKNLPFRRLFALFSASARGALQGIKY